MGVVVVVVVCVLCVCVNSFLFTCTVAKMLRVPPSPYNGARFNDFVSHRSTKFSDAALCLHRTPDL